MVNNLASLLSRVGGSTLELLFPLQCLGCHIAGHLICPECAASSPRLMPPYCRLCGQPTAGQLCRWCAERPLQLDGLRAPFLMKGLIREAVHSLKYHNVRAAASDMGRLLVNYLTTHAIPGDIVVPVPLHPRRHRSRGYNQSALLAREVGRLTGLPVNEGLLRRTRNAPPQVSLGNREERRLNAAGSFACTGDATGLALLLVDDVATTGSTLSACAAALKSAGAATVWGLVLAREV